MKNLVAFYYNIYINEYRKNNDSFKFEINGEKYNFILYDGSIDELLKTYLILKEKNVYCHEIIVNKENSIVTFYDEKPYILVKENACKDRYINIDTIIRYDIFIGQNYLLSWKKLWEQKIDYYEYQMSQLSFKYPKIKHSFNYYVGVTECAISLLNYVDESKINNFVSHKRIFYKEKDSNFLNPLEIIIDSRTRDLSEYIKINYLNENIDIKQVFYYIDNLNLSYDESILFLSRLLYPSYYFDLYDKIIQGKLNEEKIEFYTKRNDSYEMFIKKIYSHLKRIYSIPNVEWLNN